MKSKYKTFRAVGTALLGLGMIALLGLAIWVFAMWNHSAKRVSKELIIVLTVLTSVLVGIGLILLLIAVTMQRRQIRQKMESDTSEASFMICPACGINLSAGSDFCPKCGNKIQGK